MHVGLVQIFSHFLQFFIIKLKRNEKSIQTPIIDLAKKSIPRGSVFSKEKLGNCGEFLSPSFLVFRFVYLFEILFFLLVFLASLFLIILSLTKLLLAGRKSRLV